MYPLGFDIKTGEICEMIFASYPYVLQCSNSVNLPKRGETIASDFYNQLIDTLLFWLAYYQNRSDIAQQIMNSYKQGIQIINQAGIIVPPPIQTPYYITGQFGNYFYAYQQVFNSNFYIGNYFYSVPKNVLSYANKGEPITKYHVNLLIRATTNVYNLINSRFRILKAVY